MRIDDLNRLHPKVKQMALDLLDAAKKAGLNVDIFETYRTKERSDELYATGMGVKGGYSYHNYGLAVDIVFKDSSGNWTWDNSYDWERLAQLGESVGFEAGRRWPRVDSPHFQYTFGLSIEDLLNGKTPPISDKFIDWSQAAGLCNNKNWNNTMTKYEIIVFANRLVKYIFKEIERLIKNK